MPELPEVELNARLLRRHLLDQRLIAVFAREGRPTEGDPSTFSALAGRTVQGVMRHGKQLYLDLGDTTLGLHLGMTGRLCLASPDTLLPSLAATFTTAAVTVALVDPRRLGRLRRLDAPDLTGLGPDALAIARHPQALAARFVGCRAPLKIALMDQARLAGVGNIYASEALFAAALSPTIPAGTLSLKGWRRLGEALALVMEATLVSDAEGLRYLSEGATNPFLVYGREGAPCPRCRLPLTREVQAGRSTFSCPRCQRPE